MPADLVPEPDLETAEAAGRSAGSGFAAGGAARGGPAAAAASPDAGSDDASAAESWGADSWDAVAPGTEGWTTDPDADPRFQIGVDDDIIAVDRPFGGEEALIKEADAPPLAPQDALPADDAFGDRAEPETDEAGAFDDSAADDPSDARAQAVASREASSLDGLRLNGRPSDGDPGDGEAAARARRPAARPKPGLLSHLLGAAATALLVAVAALFIWRSDLVRLVPSLAGFYQLFGLEVNLRGLQLHEVRAVRADVEGVPVLSIEGFVFNPGPKAAEVPKLRMAIVGSGGRELYVWTAEPPQPMLKAGESFVLRSRLAAPPQDGQEVVVRFLRKRDMANSKP